MQNRKKIYDDVILSTNETPVQYTINDSKLSESFPTRILLC